MAIEVEHLHLLVSHHLVLAAIVVAGVDRVCFGMLILTRVENPVARRVHLELLLLQLLLLVL